MLQTDRPDFESKVAQLCAGFNVPVTAERLDAYWIGLQRMELPRFARVVEHALGERGPDRIPTVSQVWGLSKELRARPSANSESFEAPASFDHFHAFGQRCLLLFLQHHGALDDDRLAAAIREKNRLVADFRSISAGEQVTAEEVRETLFAAFRKVAA